MSQDHLSKEKQTLSIALRWKRLRVCIICWWYIRHWPMDDLTDEDWVAQLDWGSPWEVFLEGWCRD